MKSVSTETTSIKNVKKKGDENIMDQDDEVLILNPTVSCILNGRLQSVVS